MINFMDEDDVISIIERNRKTNSKKIREELIRYVLKKLGLNANDENISKMRMIISRLYPDGIKAGGKK